MHKPKQSKLTGWVRWKRKQSEEERLKPSLTALRECHVRKLTIKTNDYGVQCGQKHGNEEDATKNDWDEDHIR